MYPLKNKTYLIKYRRKLRKNPTRAESVLWKYLRSKKFEGIKFRRQFSVDNYILDFYCPKYKLAIELDGEHHFTEEGLKKDKERDWFLKEIRIKVLRFENELVMKRLESVLDEIGEEIEKRKNITEVDK